MKSPFFPTGPPHGASSVLARERLPWWKPTSSSPSQHFHLESVAQMSHEKKTALLSIDSWFFNRDPYNGLL